MLYWGPQKLFWAASWLLASACTATPPSGVFVCNADPHCPRGQVCDLASARCVGYLERSMPVSASSDQATAITPTQVTPIASSAGVPAINGPARANDHPLAAAGVMATAAAGAAAVTRSQASPLPTAAASSTAGSTASAGAHSDSAAAGGGSAAISTNASAGRGGSAHAGSNAAGSGGNTASEPAGGAGSAGAGGAAPTIEDLPNWLVNPRSWFCIQTNGGCACIDGEGTQSDTCRRPKGPCCYVLTNEDLANCQCYAYDNEACIEEGGSAAAVKVQACPPTRL